MIDVRDKSIEVTWSLLVGAVLFVVGITRYPTPGRFTETAVVALSVMKLWLALDGFMETGRLGTPLRLAFGCWLTAIAVLLLAAVWF